ncbi:hypothetical protein HDU76_006177 [Blyttiomyces sp. JEL0837]|nr:hypothetical protein HDU76_006177 [Blyttiomyces sp. JEL0837]
MPQQQHQSFMHSPGSSVDSSNFFDRDSNFGTNFDDDFQAQYIPQSPDIKDVMSPFFERLEEMPQQQQQTPSTSTSDAELLSLLAASLSSSPSESLLFAPIEASSPPLFSTPTLADIELRCFLVACIASITPLSSPPLTTTANTIKSFDSPLVSNLTDPSTYAFLEALDIPTSGSIRQQQPQQDSFANDTLTRLLALASLGSQPNVIPEVMAMLQKLPGVNTQQSQASSVPVTNGGLGKVNRGNVRSTPAATTTSVTGAHPLSPPMSTLIGVLSTTGSDGVFNGILSSGAGLESQVKNKVGRKRKERSADPVKLLEEIDLKRMRNTESARRSRLRRMAEVQGLKESLESAKKERDDALKRAALLEEELRKVRAQLGLVLQ